MNSQVRKASLKTIVLIAIALFILVFGLFENLVLTYYSNGIYPVLSTILRFFSSIFPFAIGDLLYSLIILLAIVKLILFILKIKRKHLKKHHQILIPLQVTNTILILFIAFKLFWGLNYSRPKIAEQLKISEDKYDVKQLVQLCHFFIDKLNSLQEKKDLKFDYSTSQISASAIKSYQKMAAKNAFFEYRQPSIKPALSSWWTSKMGIEGYYNPLSGEANLNTKLPLWVLPFVTCHEISHQLGIAKEDEANLVAYLVGINSDDLNFQYSVNYNMLRYVLLEVKLKSPEDYLAIRERISAPLLANFQAENDFWRQYNGQMSGYMGIAFDKFLKLNNQKRGIKSYQNIVIWLWNYHKVAVGREKQGGRNKEQKTRNKE